jgi:DNA adenine methylase
LLPILLPLIAERKHICYVEPFAGSFTVGFNKPRAAVNVLNDMDGEMLNAFRQLQRHSASLLEELDGMINSREEMYRLKASKGEGLTEIQRAAWFLWTVHISFGSDGRTFGVVRTGPSGAATRVSALMSKVKALRQHLDGVIIEHLDWLRCLRLYDSPDTLFFLDPPYTTGKVASYAMFTAADMDALRDGLLELKGAWVLTVDDTADNRRRFGQWLAGLKTSRSGVCNQAKGSKDFKELICASWKGGPADV